MSPPAKPKLLLHGCCAPCVTHPVRMLGEKFDVTVFFYNPNIQPAEEYRSRLAEIRRLSEKWRFPLVEGSYECDAWSNAVRGLEGEPEGGRRCTICYRIRLERTARNAKTLGMDCFASTLSISPHKKAGIINRIGMEIGYGAGIRFIEADFKKMDGFKASCELSRMEGLYRQDFCGCVYSRRDRGKTK
jgi:predicted adenine nucleotide alpha hydrolase (AANH) superfamily ATPase